MKCRYCGSECERDYCSKEHKYKHQNSIENMIPKVSVKSLSEQEILMQQKFIKKLKAKDKKEKLQVSLGAI